jgi:hypothetical protein
MNALRAAVVNLLVRDGRYGEVEEDYVDLTDEDIADLVRRMEKHLFNG